MKFIMPLIYIISSNTYTFMLSVSTTHCKQLFICVQSIVYSNHKKLYTLLHYTNLLLTSTLFAPMAGLLIMTAGLLAVHATLFEEGPDFSCKTGFVLSFLAVVVAATVLVLAATPTITSSLGLLLVLCLLVSKVAKR